ncbi:MAG: GNAT family N-acetyltransferase, partial [Desulfohalobiaceae bacterium]|nr:GNAT family N-acetyltransferase [Desulfohalobiaceae bacterium]
DDGATFQVSLGAALESLFKALSAKNDLGVHTHFLSDGIMHLTSMGVTNNRMKEINKGQTVAGAAVGSDNLYEFINDNPGVTFYPSNYVNNPSIIAQHGNMVAINVALAMDLSGQTAADALPINHFTGVSGMMDFMRGAWQAEKGKSILMFPSTSEDGTRSRIVPALDDTAVAIPRSDIHYVATEFGVVNLFGKTLEERALALISIAHPDFRDELFVRAGELGLISSSRRADESLHGVYPVRLEESQTINGQEILFRPAKPVDGRLIQEHFYGLDNLDVISRFLHQKSRFPRKEVSPLYEVDYITNLTLVAVTGEVGYERVIAVGGYQLEPGTNLAELSFSVVRDWQGHGLGTIIQAKLAEVARENNIKGLVAYVTPENRAMITLFKKLPFQVTSLLEPPHLVKLQILFNEPL